MSDDIAMMTASRLVKLYRSGALSPVEAARAVLDRIERYNGKLNAFNLVAAEAALASAAESEERWRLGAPRGPLDGVPTAIKDVLLTKGWPTLRGSKAIPRDQRWEEDAPSVARLREHGAVMLGKVTTPEFGWKGVTDSPLDGITRNPWDPTKTPGGSSGGTAAALAAGLCTLAPGSDAGGSVRSPAAFFNSTDAGGVLSSNVNERSWYTLITTGMIIPSCEAVLALNSLQNAMMLTPC